MSARAGNGQWRVGLRMRIAFRRCRRVVLLLVRSDNHRSVMPTKSKVI
jgi:hypothetical protein